ncbi:hypothetical protein BS47DRAFT_1342959, partial [Hydnum rufescens UP504]
MSTEPGVYPMVPQSRLSMGTSGLSEDGVVLSPAARANQRQNGPRFDEVNIEFPIANGVANVETMLIYPINPFEPSNPLARSTNRLAVLLHPWGRMGGHYHDPVLMSLVTTFLRRDFHILSYNSRGVGHSGGSSSLTGLAEAEDLRTLVDHALQQIPSVVEIVLLGYSFGCLPVSLHPPRLNFSMDRPYISPDLVIRHVLLSYPVGVLWALTFFHSDRYTKAVLDLLSSPYADVLVLYGDTDQFTKISKYDAWVSKLRQAAGGDTPGEASSPPRGRLTTQVFHDTDHFWDGGQKREMWGFLAIWLDQGPTSTQ